MGENINFKVNNKVEIAWNDEYYKSNIQDVTESYIAISIPTKEGQYLPLRKGDQIEVFYYEGKEIYKFYTIVLGRKIERIAIFLMAMPKDILHVQRRKFVRVPIVCTVECSKLDKEISTKDIRSLVEGNKLQFKAIMIDLSAGGMRIKTNADVKKGDIIISYLTVDGGDLVVKGKVVRLDKDEDKRNDCGIDFIDLENKQREKLIRYIFQIMRDQMKKGLKGD